MAGRTFGGAIKLTGEDKYQKALGMIKTNLSVVSSELKAVTSSFDKNNASQEDLTKSNEVLTKKLETQKEKLKILEDALQDAKKETDENSVTTKKWQTELNKAQAEVNKTALEIKKNTTQLNEMAVSSKNAGNEANEFGKNIKDAGNESSNFADIVKGNVLASFIVDGIKTIASEVSEMAKSFIEIGNSVQKSNNKMQASLGLTTTEAKKYNSVMQEIYNSGYGESFEDVAQKISYVRQVTGEVDSSKLKDLTTNAMALENTFGSDFNETIRGVNNLMTHFGIDSQEAFDLFAKGSQLGLDYTSELGDNVAEYGGNFKQAGYSAEEYFQLLQNGTKNGAYNLDKVNDSINEIKNRLGDGTIKDNLSLFSKDTQKAFKNWENGKGTMKDVINSVVNDINSCKNEQEQLNMAATAFGTMGEDANLKVVTSLTTVGDSFKDVKGSMDDINNLQFSDIGSAFESIKRQLTTGISTAVYSNALPAFNALSDGINNAMNGDKIDASKMGDAIGKFISDIGVMIVDYIPQLADFVVDGLTGLVSSLSSNLGDITDKLLDGIVTIISQIAESLPELIPTVISGIIDALASFNEHMDDFLAIGFQIISGLIQGIINSIPEIIANLPTIIMAILNFFSISKFLSLGVNIVKGLWNGIQALGGSTLKGWIVGFVKNLINFFKNPLTGIKDIGKNLVKGLWNGISDMGKWISEKITGFGKNVLNSLKSFFGIHSPSTVFRDEIGKNLALGIGVGFENQISSVTEQIKSSIPTNYDVIADVSSSVNSNLMPFNASDEGNFNVTINNNSKYISPATNARQLKSQAQWYYLTKRRAA